MNMKLKKMPRRERFKKLCLAYKKKIKRWIHHNTSHQEKKVLVTSGLLHLTKEDVRETSV